MTTAYIGQPISRVDGRAKVTGEAKYAAEHNVPNLTYGFVVSSAIAKGTIKRIDASKALGLDGVLQVFTHENAPRTAWLDRNYRDDIAPPGSPFRPLYDGKILFSQQPVALVVADTFETARYAASLVQIHYEREPHATDLGAARTDAYEPKKRSAIGAPPSARGDAEAAFASAAVQHDAEYTAPAQHHNPMESFATTVVWEGDGRLTIYEKTQGPQNNQRYVSKVFGLSTDDVRVMVPFVGGAFGSGLRPQYQLFLAVMAAQELKRSVRVSLTRQQMFSLGHRPTIMQRVALGAGADGTLQSVSHSAISETSRFEDYSETVADWSGVLYHCENVTLDYKVAQLDVNTPVDMRAPGAAWGLWALESAMDELAVKLRIDPLELRLRNYAEKDLNENKPFSSKELRECFRQGAERFGWSKRSPHPRAIREGHNLVGWGIADASSMPSVVSGNADAACVR